MTLNLNIEVNDEDFSKMCIENINDLPKEKLQEILLKAVDLALVGDKEKVYGVQKNSTVLVAYSDYSSQYEPTKLMKTILEKANFEKYFEDVAEEIANYIKDNYKRILQDSIVETFTKVLFNAADNWDLRRHICDAIRRG